VDAAAEAGLGTNVLLNLVAVGIYLIMDCCSSR
jgi:hypothetical protein